MNPSSTAPMDPRAWLPYFHLNIFPSVTPCYVPEWRYIFAPRAELLDVSTDLGAPRERPGESGHTSAEYFARDGAYCKVKEMDCMTGMGEEIQIAAAAEWGYCRGAQ